MSKKLIHRLFAAAIAACVPGLKPGDTSPDRKFFQWNMCWYKYSLGNQTFPVVNYVVKRPKW